MALKRFEIDGYGQLELNNVFFRREGAIEAQCALDPASFATEGKASEDLIYAENGMILAVDKANGKVKLPDGSVHPLALHYSTEHMYDERKKNLGSWYLPAGTFYPRMGYLQRGEIFTTNCLCYDTDEFADDETLADALTESVEGFYGVPSEIGAIKITKTPGEASEVRVVLSVAKYYTMPNGTPGVKFQVALAV